MGELQLRITSRAARDLEEIATYIARDNPVAAERFGLALVEKAELLKTFPMLGRKVKETEENRVLVKEPVLIFYRSDNSCRRYCNQTLLARRTRSAGAQVSSSRLGQYLLPRQIRPQRAKTSTW
jgi:toxin ParE1/3/4